MNTGNKGTTEGRLTRSVESQTAQIPSMGYLGAAIGSMAGLCHSQGIQKGPMGVVCRAVGSSFSDTRFV
jgi:hypothetical protein